MNKRLYGAACAVLMIFTGLTAGAWTPGHDDPQAEPIIQNLGTLRPFWYETWGGTEDDIPLGIDVEDDVVYLAGATFGTETTHAFLLKYDIDGNLLWEVTMDDGTVASDVAVYDNAVYVTGAIDENGGNVFLSKYTADGTHVWTETWGGSSADAARGMSIANDNIYLVGTSGSFGALSTDIVVIKYGIDGTFKWFTLWGGKEAEEGSGIIAASDGAYVTGVTDSYDKGGGDAVVMKLDGSGNVVWAKTWGGEAAEWGTSLTMMEQYVYVTGYTRSYTGSIVLLKYGEDGNMQWERRWGGENDMGYAVTSFGTNVYVAGITYEDGADACILKYDGDGTLFWAKAWGGKESEEAWCIDVEAERIYLAGTTESYGNGGDDVFLLKCNLEGRKRSIASMPLSIMNDAIMVFGRIVMHISTAPSDTIDSKAPAMLML